MVRQTDALCLTTPPRRRIVLIGATGFFGQRLAGLLAELSDVELIATSRTIDRARALAETIVRRRPDAQVAPAAFDTSSDVEMRLQALRPWLVIDASGPFQSADYRVARAALAAGAHWIDLADARDYILGFAAALDATAKAAGRMAICGASSTPALSSAAAAALTAGWRRVDTVDIAICPAGRGKVGPSVVRAILSYAGRPIATWRNGELTTTTGWGWPERIDIANVGRRAVSAVETADAELLSQQLGTTSRVSFSAGLEQRIEHYGLWLLGQMRRAGIVGNLEPLTGLLTALRRVTGLFASDRGAMTVRAAGIDQNGQPVTAHWTLVARAGDGPFVPVLPALALTRRLLADDACPGASRASNELTLDQIEREMVPLSISCDRAAWPMSGRGVIADACGEAAYERLPAAVRAFHDPAAAAVWTGRADADGGETIQARLIGRLIGMPGTLRDVPVTVVVDRPPDTERWTRTFGTASFMSELSPASFGFITERFGLLRFKLAVVVRDGALHLPVVQWRAGPLPMPLALAPVSIASETEDDAGVFRFDVKITLRFAGRLAHYRGWLKPKCDTATGLVPDLDTMRARNGHERDR